MNIADQLGEIYGSLERTRQQHEATLADLRRTRRWVKAQVVVFVLQVVIAVWMVTR